MCFLHFAQGSEQTPLNRKTCFEIEARVEHENLRQLIFMLEGEGIPLVRRSNKVTQNYSKNGGAPDPTGRWQVKRSGTSLAQGGIT